MLIVLSPFARARLARIEAEFGIPAAEVVHEAVETWLGLTAIERLALASAVRQRRSA